MNPLSPDVNIHRFLISTPSRLVGQWETDDIAIHHAWQGVFDGRADPARGMTENPVCRNYFMLSLAAPGEDNDSGRGRRVNYSGFGETVAALMAVLYGKRFDYHGPVQASGLFHVPFMPPIPPSMWIATPPYSHSPRPDLCVPLNLVEFGRIAPAMTEGMLPDDRTAILLSACRFYSKSLSAIDVDPGSAYLDLITCGEMLSGCYEYKDADLYDEATLRAFERVENGLEDGGAIARRFRSSMRQIKRRFTLTLTRFLDQAFFVQSPGPTGIAGTGSFSPENIDKAVKAAYDVRSGYLHTGSEFGQWAVSPVHRLADLPIGRPVLNNEEFAKALGRAPTYLGLERLIRYALLRFAEERGVPIRGTPAAQVTGS